MKAFFIALQFLTILPVPRFREINDKDIGRSLFYYPWVGLIIGGLLYAAYYLLQTLALDSWVSAGLILTLWVALSGGLHLDGLADMADAWVGGHHDKDKCLAIMKDPTCGPMGVIILVLTLLLKLLVIHALIEKQFWQALLLVPILGRSMGVVLLLTTPYVRKGGLGEALVQHASRVWVTISLLLAFAVTFYLLQQPSLYLLSALVAGLILFRLNVMGRIQGITGDLVGALIEGMELLGLLVLLILSQKI